MFGNSYVIFLSSELKEVKTEKWHHKLKRAHRLSRRESNDQNWKVGLNFSFVAQYIFKFKFCFLVVDFAQRPDDGGKIGDRIPLLANFLELKLKAGTIRHYHMTIKEKGNRRFRKFGPWA